MLLFIPCLSEFFLLERCISDTTYFHDNTLVYFYQLYRKHLMSLFRDRVSPRMASLGRGTEGIT